MCFVSIFTLYIFFLHLTALFYAISIYIFYHGIIDHSGIAFKAYWWQPWQPDAIFHDNHHQYFHVNYGFNMFLWDKVWVFSMGMIRNIWFNWLNVFFSFMAHTGWRTVCIERTFTMAKEKRWMKWHRKNWQEILPNENQRIQKHIEAIPMKMILLKRIWRSNDWI